MKSMFAPAHKNSKYTSMPQQWQFLFDRRHLGKHWIVGKLPVHYTGVGFEPVCATLTEQDV